MNEGVVVVVDALCLIHYVISIFSIGFKRFSKFVLNNHFPKIVKKIQTNFHSKNQTRKRLIATTWLRSRRIQIAFLYRTRKTIRCAAEFIIIIWMLLISCNDLCFLSCFLLQLVFLSIRIRVFSIKSRRLSFFIFVLRKYWRSTMKMRILNHWKELTALRMKKSRYSLFMLNLSFETRVNWRPKCKNNLLYFPKS